MIDTDLKFSILRLVSLLEKYIVKKNVEEKVDISSENMENFILDCLTRLHVVQCHDSSELVITSHSLESVICEDPNIAVLMIDSISAFYWIDRLEGGDSVLSQETNMKLVTDKFAQLVNTYSLVLIATKHAVFKKKAQNIQGLHESQLDRLQGLPQEDFAQQHAEFMCRAWQKLVTHRLIVLKEGSSTEDQGQSFIISNGSQGPVKFHITQSGIEFV